MAMAVMVLMMDILEVCTSYSYHNENQVIR